MFFLDFPLTNKMNLFGLELPKPIYILTFGLPVFAMSRGKPGPKTSFKMAGKPCK